MLVSGNHFGRVLLSEASTGYYQIVILAFSVQPKSFLFDGRQTRWKNTHKSFISTFASLHLAITMNPQLTQMCLKLQPGITYVHTHTHTHTLTVPGKTSLLCSHCRCRPMSPTESVSGSSPLQLGPGTLPALILQQSLSPTYYEQVS